MGMHVNGAHLRARAFTVCGGIPFEMTSQSANAKIFLLLNRCFWLIYSERWWDNGWGRAAQDPTQGRKPPQSPRLAAEAAASKHGAFRLDNDFLMEQLSATASPIRLSGRVYVQVPSDPGAIDGQSGSVPRIMAKKST